MPILFTFWSHRECKIHPSSCWQPLNMTERRWNNSQLLWTNTSKPMLCITSHRVTGLLQCLHASSQSFLSCTDNLTQRSWFIYNAVMRFSQFKTCLHLFSEVTHPPDRAVRPGLQTVLLFTHLFLLFLFFFFFVCRWWKRSELGGLFRQDAWG